MAVVTASMYRGARPGLVSAQDTEITAGIASAERWIEASTGRSLESAERVEEYEMPAWSTGVIQLTQIPVTAVASVDRWSGTAWTGLTTDQYALRSGPKGLLQVGGRGGSYSGSTAQEIGPVGLSAARDEAPTLRITYTAGYASDSLAASLRESFYMVVDAVRAERGSFTIAVSDGFSGVTKVNRTADDYRIMVRALMAPFRVVAL